MKLTNEKLAEALGYTYKQFPIYYGGYSKRTGWYLGKNFKFEKLPNFLNSLDSLIKECERLNLIYMIQKFVKPNTGYYVYVSNVTTKLFECSSRNCKEALVNALYSYLTR